MKYFPIECLDMSIILLLITLNLTFLLTERQALDGDCFLPMLNGMKKVN